MLNKLAALAVKAAGWRITIDTTVPTEGAIIIGAPHTSNWDFIMMLSLAHESGIRLRWLGKKSLFWWPLGPLLRKLGGIPVDRSGHHGLVEQIAYLAHLEAPLYLGITPEGTRDRTEYWKSGFYRIALASQLPLQLGYVDKATHTAGLGPVLLLSGSMSADMEQIRHFYRDKGGIRPNRAALPRLRGETEQ